MDGWIRSWYSFCPSPFFFAVCCCWWLFLSQLVSVSSNSMNSQEPINPGTAQYQDTTRYISVKFFVTHEQLSLNWYLFRITTCDVNGRSGDSAEKWLRMCDVWNKQTSNLVPRVSLLCLPPNDVPNNKGGKGERPCERGWQTSADIATNLVPRVFLRTLEEMTAGQGNEDSGNEIASAPLAAVTLAILPLGKWLFPAGKQFFMCNRSAQSEIDSGKSPWIRQKEQRNCPWQFQM